MNEDYEGAEQSAPSAELAKSRGRGASLLTIRIYKAVAEAGSSGLTAAEIHDRIKDVPGFASDTEGWWRVRNIRSTDSTSVHFDINTAGLARVQRRVQSLLIPHGGEPVLKSLGHGGRGKSRYVAGRPPKGFRTKKVPQPGPHGYYDIDPAADEAATRRHIDIVNWLREADAQLAKKNPRRLRELVEQACALFRS